MAADFVQIQNGVRMMCCFKRVRGSNYDTRLGQLSRGKTSMKPSWQPSKLQAWRGHGIRFAFATNDERSILHLVTPDYTVEGAYDKLLNGLKMFLTSSR